jgi:hypothetical protein
LEAGCQLSDDSLSDLRSICEVILAI